MRKKRFDRYEQAGLRIGRIARLWRIEIDRRLAPFGLTEARWLTLLHLSRLEPPVRQKELAIAMAVQGPTLVRTLDWLEANRYIERQTNRNDRRVNTIQLTKQSRPVLEQIQTATVTVRKDIFANIDSSDVDVCLRVFEQMVANLHEIAPKTGIE